MKKRVGILRFKASSEQLNYLTDGIQDLLIAELSRAEDYFIISKESTKTDATDSTELTTLAKKLSVEILVSGQIEETDDFQFSLQFHYISENRIKEKEFSVEKKDLFKLGERSVEQVKKELSIREETNLEDLPRIKNPVVNQQYLLGNYYFNKWTGESVEKAIELYEQVIEKEESFAPVYLKLANCYIFQAGRGLALPQSIYPKARKVIDKALGINPNSGEALIHKNLIDFFYDLDWSNIYNSIEKGLENYVDASEAYQQLSFFWYGLKEYDASLDALYSALEFDPLSTGILNMIGDVQLSAKRYNDARQTFLSILKMTPQDTVSLENLMYIAALENNETQSIRYFRKLQKELPDDRPYTPRMGYVFGKFGLEKEAAKYLAHYQEKQQENPNGVFHNYKAQVFAGSGDLETLIEHVEKGWEARTGILYILTDPQLEPIHKWKRYQKLVAQIKLPTKVEDVNYITLTTDTKETLRVNLNALLLAQAEDNYTRLHFFQNFRMEQKLVRATLSKVSQQLPEYFFRVHKTYLFNSSQPFQLIGNSRTRYILQDQHDLEIPVSRSIQKETLQQLQSRN